MEQIDEQNSDVDKSNLYRCSRECCYYGEKQGISILSRHCRPAQKIVLVGVVAAVVFHSIVDTNTIATTKKWHLMNAHNDDTYAYTS
jgi:hypothetical protein